MAKEKKVEQITDMEVDFAQCGYKYLGTYTFLIIAEF